MGAWFVEGKQALGINQVKKMDRKLFSTSLPFELSSTFAVSGLHRKLKLLYLFSHQWKIYLSSYYWHFVKRQIISKGKLYDIIIENKGVLVIYYLGEVYRRSTAGSAGPKYIGAGGTSAMNRVSMGEREWFPTSQPCYTVSTE